VGRLQPISPFPEALFEATEDPASFQEALVYHMRRFGDTYWQLYRDVVHLNETFDNKTLLSWIQGERVPRSVASFNILRRIEQRYRLSEGYFKEKLPHRGRSLYGHDFGDISPAERRRISLHLPEDFNSLPFTKREEILDWVRRVIISGSTEYRRYQAAASKQRYAIRFPGVTYGSRFISSRSLASATGANQNVAAELDDPDLLSGVVDAPPKLAMEMADLVRFKTSTLTAIGFQRNGVWGEETASQKIEHLGLMFGALAASPNGVVKGFGLPVSQLSLGLLVFPAVWDWYLQWREQRRGFYTKWEEDMLMVAQALTRADVGWVRQHLELLQNVRLIKGLIEQEEVEFAARDWHGPVTLSTDMPPTDPKKSNGSCVFTEIPSSQSCVSSRPTAHWRNIVRLRTRSLSGCRMKADTRGQRPKPSDPSCSSGLASISGSDKRTFANFVSAPVDTIRRQNAGLKI
jgi:hypothetical protein